MSWPFPVIGISTKFSERNARLDGPNRVHRRTLSRLNKLDAKLRDWNTSAARNAVAVKLQARVPHTASTT